MRLIYLHDVPLPGLAANTVNVAKMCSAFTGIGYEVSLICPPAAFLARSGDSIANIYELQHQFKVRRLPLLPMAGGRRVFSWLGALCAKLLNAHIIYARKPALLAPALGGSAQLALEVHVSWDEMGPRDRSAFLSLEKSSNFCRLVCISSALKDDFIGRFPTLSPITIVAHDGADALSLPPAPRICPNAERTLVGYAGHLYPGKGMEIISKLVKECPWADFLIVGGTTDSVAVWKDRLAEFQNVNFIGFVPHGLVPEYLASCDIVLAPYQNEVRVSDGKTNVARWMSPLKIFEYMAQGKAIIVSNLPVLQEVLTNEDTALMADPDDLGAWVLCLQRLANDCALRTMLGRQAKLRFEQEYTWASRASKVLTGLNTDGRP